MNTTGRPALTSQERGNLAAARVRQWLRSSNSQAITVWSIR
jgi:hypothetical protein